MRSAAAASTTPRPSDSAVAVSFFKRPGSLPASDYTRRVATDQTLGILASRLEELNRVGAALSAERNTSRLLEPILTKAREITSSDAGSLYHLESTDPAPI